MRFRLRQNGSNRIRRPNKPQPQAWFPPWQCTVKILKFSSLFLRYFSLIKALLLLFKQKQTSLLFSVFICDFKYLSPYCRYFRSSRFFISATAATAASPQSIATPPTEPPQPFFSPFPPVDSVFSIFLKVTTLLESPNAPES